MVLTEKIAFGRLFWAGVRGEGLFVSGHIIEVCLAVGKGGMVVRRFGVGVFCAINSHVRQGGCYDAARAKRDLVFACSTLWVFGMGP